MADFPPTHPGEVLREDFLQPPGLNRYACAKALGVPRIRAGEIVDPKRATGPDSALRLARPFGPRTELRLGKSLAAASAPPATPRSGPGRLSTTPKV